MRAAIDDHVALARRNRNERIRRHAERGEIGAELRLDAAELGLAVGDLVHLVDDDGDPADAEQMQQKTVPPALLAHAFGGIDHQQRGVRLGGTRHHVLQELDVARRIDQQHIAVRRVEPDLAGVDGDALVALGLQRVEQERPFERHAAPLAHAFDGLELAVGQRARVVHQPADQGRLAVIDVTDDDDAHGCPLGQGGLHCHRRGNWLDRGFRHHRYPAVRSRSKASSVS